MMSAGKVVVSAMEKEIRDGRGCSDESCTLPLFFDDLGDDSLDAVITTLGRMLAVRHECYISTILYHMIQERDRRRQDEYSELLTRHG